MNQNQFKMQIEGIKLGRCKYGWMIYDGPYIGKCLELYGEYSESEVSVFKSCIKQGDVAIEIGANIGSLTLPISQLVGPEGRVIAVESHPETFNILCANLAINGLKNVKPINSFVANSNDVETSSPVWGKYAFVSEIWETQYLKLDDILLPRLDFMKVDVDGNELAVLKSGVRHIEKYKPIIYFENDLKDRSPDLLQWIMALGYRVFFHLAPIFLGNNFYENPENAWAPKVIHSLMMLAVPDGNPIPIGLREVESPNDWWQD